MYRRDASQEPETILIQIHQIMAFLTIQELNTHLHDEQVETITRGDETIAQAAIDAAIAEAKGYLTRFDCTRIFSTSGNKRNSCY